ncbi:MAG: PF20097 family protein [Acidobacteriota bacterium]|nr:PF20097 family protein [Acidobacteriota bacterium]
MVAEIKCSKCNDAMAEGFILDLGDYDYKRQQIWVEGQPASSFWSGIKISDRTAFNVQAFRCVSCNFLEFYSTEKTSL